jgi:aldehyde dehydrogenase (NAD+)
MFLSGLFSLLRSFSSNCPLLIDPSRIFSPWNYPFAIILIPLIGAVVAVIGSSEHAPACVKALVDLFPKYLDSNAYAIINGAVKETTQLLDLRWDYIFYTGSTDVGKIVAAVATKHVMPHTLELGGKCPVYIDDKTGTNLAAKSILFG